MSKLVHRLDIREYVLRLHRSSASSFFPVLANLSVIIKNEEKTAREIFILIASLIESYLIGFLLTAYFSRILYLMGFPHSSLFPTFECQRMKSINRVLSKQDEFDCSSQGRLESSLFAIVYCLIKTAQACIPTNSTVGIRNA